MRVFISWSKPRSHGVALVLHDWLPSVIQRVKPWMSSEDIDKGKRWGAELWELLSTTSQGIVCVTADNVHEPWLNFEAGALAKSVTSAQVRPVLLDVHPADVVGPLAQFQATSLTDRDDVLKLVGSLNASTDDPVEPALLKKSFGRAWPELDEAISRLAGASAGDDVPSVRRPEDKIDEILGVVRSIERRVERHPARPPDEGFIFVDLTRFDPALDILRYPIRAYDTVSHFLTAVYYALEGHVPAYTYGERWELYDVARDIVLSDFVSAWPTGADAPQEDHRRLDQVGLRDGKLLLARPAQMLRGATSGRADS